MITVQKTCDATCDVKQEKVAAQIKKLQRSEQFESNVEALCVLSVFLIRQLGGTRVRHF